MKKEFYYTSREGKVKIHAIEWIPEGEIRGILQISHGMVEYIDRYHDFAEYLNQFGYYVVGQDHLGHGQSVQSEEEYGHFPEGEGNQYVIGDIHQLREITARKYPGIPYYMLGHSMGSFLLRQYLSIYGRGLAGAVIMGTGYQGIWILRGGQLLCRIEAAKKGWHHRSERINQLGFGGFNRKFEPGETKKDWVTSDREMCRRYNEDPLCSFVFTVGGYHQMFEGMKHLTKLAYVERIPKNLPVLMVSGADDPVGGFGRGVRKVYRQYKKAGIRDVVMKLYPGDRHEILNETDRGQVYEDIRRWLDGVGRVKR